MPAHCAVQTQSFATTRGVISLYRICVSRGPVGVGSRLPLLYLGRVIEYDLVHCMPGAYSSPLRYSDGTAICIVRYQLSRMAHSVGILQFCTPPEDATPPVPVWEWELGGRRRGALPGATPVTSRREWAGRRAAPGCPASVRPLLFSRSRTIRSENPDPTITIGVRSRAGAVHGAVHAHVHAHVLYGTRYLDARDDTLASRATESETDARMREAWREATRPGRATRDGSHVTGR